MNSNRRLKRIIIRIIKIILIVYAISGILVWHLQEKLLLHPVPLVSSATFDFKLPHREWTISVTDKDTLSIVQFFAVSTNKKKGAILFFHGNRENINRYVRYATPLTQKGYDVWMVDYPGFGKTTGRFTEQRVYQDARIVYQLAEKDIAADSIIIYGKSLGTGIAAELASVKKCRRLILETPYYSIPQLAWDHFPFYPTSRMSRYHLPTYQYLPYVDSPVTIFHGTDDGVIPHKHASRLKQVLKSKDEFVTIPDAIHNNLLDFELFRKKLNDLL
jgi:alpha-beta hydrolase superfamily lysophospholipase